MQTEFKFTFDNYTSGVLITEELPSINEIRSKFSIGDSAGNSPGAGTLMVCDANTEALARKIRDAGKEKLLVLEANEESKNWDTVEKILRCGRDAGLGRDGLFLAIGGGLVCDLTAFAASVYMRGAKLCLVSTSLLGMVDASLGGKTGINLFGLKNLAGSFYPAAQIFLPLAALDTLPEREWKSGLAELIKTAILDSDEFLEETKKLISFIGRNEERKNPNCRNSLGVCISRAISYKGNIVEADPRETGTERALLNLGHSFGHALEAAIGLGKLNHGEAVAWGLSRACELGLVLGLTPPGRAEKIMEILTICGFKTRAPHPLAKSTQAIIDAMKGDKKQQAGRQRFVVPAAKSARIVSSEEFPLLNGKGGEELIRKIINGEYKL